MVVCDLQIGDRVGSRRCHHLVMLWIHFLCSRWVSSLSVHLSWRSSVHQSFHMDVSKNSGTPQIIHFNRVFHYKSSILEYLYFWKHPYGTCPQNYTRLVLPVGWKKLPKQTDFFPPEGSTQWQDASWNSRWKSLGKRNQQGVRQGTHRWYPSVKMRISI